MTIKDVAKLAGVSTTTVSRVINNKKSVSKKVKTKVNDAIKKLNFRINLKAKNLVKQTSDIIGVIVADISNPTITNFFDGITSRCQEYNLTILLGNSSNLIQREFEFLKLFAARKVRGVIFTGKKISEEHVELFNNYQIPLVVSSQEHDNLNCPVVVFDNYQASYDVVKLLINNGHKKIGFISCPLEDVHSGKMRLNGYINAMKDHGLKYEKEYIQYADTYDLESGYSATKKLIELSNTKPSAIFGGSDLISIGVMKYLKEKKIKIPEEIAVFGFDNSPISSKLIPSLSTVELDFYQMGLYTADMVYSMYKDKEINIKKIIFNHKIIVRESSNIKYK